MSNVVVKKRFRLRDPATGLFWSLNSPPKSPKFNEIGKQWGSLSSALRNWADYNFYRGMEQAAVKEMGQHKSALIPARALLKPKRASKTERIFNIEEDTGPFPEVLELVEYEVVETLRGTKKTKPNDMTSAVRFERNSPKQHTANSFLKSLLHKGKYPTHILLCEGQKMEVPTGVQFNKLSIPEIWGSTRGEHLYLAIYSETDMIYLRVGMSDNLQAIWSMETGKQMYERGEHGKG